MSQEYKVVAGLHYHPGTPDKVIRVLQFAIMCGHRVHVSYGDPETGRDWLEEYNVQGRILKSTGIQPVPVLLLTRRSLGGMAVLTANIVRIRALGDKKVLYQHPKYHVGELVIQDSDPPLVLPDGTELAVVVVREGKACARFAKRAQALRWLKRLGLEEFLVSEEGRPHED